MTDGSNIDDILKSIDALLKEGHEEQRRNDDVIDDAPGDISAQAVSADAEMPITEAANDAADQREISILPDVAADESEGESADVGKGETAQPEVEETDDIAADVSGKRIFLSADMQVQDGPELPLRAAVQTEQTEVRENSETAIADASLAAVDEALVARITAEICTALQRQLPEIIAPLVSEALRRHSDSGAAHEHRE